MGSIFWLIKMFKEIKKEKTSSDKTLLSQLMKKFRISLLGTVLSEMASAQQYEIVNWPPWYPDKSIQNHDCKHQQCFIIIFGILFWSGVPICKILFYGDITLGHYEAFNLISFTVFLFLYFAYLFLKTPVLPLICISWNRL